MAFSPENLKIWVDSREYSRQIQTATYPTFKKGTQNTPFTYTKSRLMPAFNPPTPYTQTQTHIPGLMHAMRASERGGNCRDLSLHCSNHSVTHVQVVLHHQITKVCTNKIVRL